MDVVRGTDPAVAQRENSQASELTSLVAIFLESLRLKKDNPPDTENVPSLWTLRNNWSYLVARG